METTTSKDGTTSARTEASSRTGWPATAEGNVGVDLGPSTVAGGSDGLDAVVRVQLPDAVLAVLDRVLFRRGEPRLGQRRNLASIVMSRSPSGTNEDKTPSNSQRSDDRSSRVHNRKSSTTLVPSRSTSRGSQMRRPSSTSRLPTGCGSPNNGIIHASGVNRSAACSSARSMALIVLPAPGRPTIRNKVAIALRRSAYVPTHVPSGG